MIFTTLLDRGSFAPETLRTTVMKCVYTPRGTSLFETGRQDDKISAAYRDGLRYLRGRGVIETISDGYIALTDLGKGLSSVEAIPKLRQLQVRMSKRGPNVPETKRRAGLAKKRPLRPSKPRPKKARSRSTQSLAKEVALLREFISKEIADFKRALRAYLEG
jgi:hypothetical protein